MTVATIGKWGNASAIRIPQPFCEQIGVTIGDSVQLIVEDRNRIVIEPLKNPYTLQARMENWDGKRYMTNEYNWGEPVGEELW